MPADRQNVACGSCRACCVGEAIALFPEDGDVVASYETRQIEIGGALVTVLRQRPDGSCVYLGENGCTIHDRAPVICRSFSCVGLYLRLMKLPRTERRREPVKGILAGEVCQAGKARAPRP